MMHRRSVPVGNAIRRVKIWPEFEEIRILCLDHDRCRRSETAPFMYTMYLELSGNPTTEWQQIFYQERRVPRHENWRRAWIEHNYIILDCVPEEIEQFHLEELKRDLETTNKKYGAWLDLKRKETRDRARARMEEQARLEALSERLCLGE